MGELSQVMSSKERVLRAYRNEPTDRVPVRIWGIEPETEPPHPSYAPIVEAAKERTDMVAGWGAATGTFMTMSEEVSVHTDDRDSRHEHYREHHQTYTTPLGDLTMVYAYSPIGKPGYMLKPLDPKVLAKKLADIFCEAGDTEKP